MALKTGSSAFYLDSLELPDYTELPSYPELYKSPSHDKEAAYVADGSIMAFTEGVPYHTKQDLLDATLLAQLAANKKFDRGTHQMEWYNKYREVLENLGFVVQGFQFSEYRITTQSFTVDEVVLSVLKAIANGELQNQVIGKALDSMKALSDGDGKMKIFSRGSNSAKVSSFQIFACSVDKDRTVVLPIGVFKLESSSERTNVFWFEYKTSDTKISTGNQAMIFNQKAYEAVRSQITNKLGDRAKKYVAEIEI